MANLEPNDAEVTKIFAAVMKFLRDNFTNTVDAAYGVQSVAHFLCKAGLAMSDADYMRFCETMMHHDRPFVSENQYIYTDGESVFVEAKDE